MSVFAVSITKTVPWRGKPAEVSNVYHYKTSAVETFDDIAAIDELVAQEKLIYASTVQFIRGRTWGPTEQGIQASKMREVKQLTGAGTRTPASSFYPEFAAMVYWPLGRYGVRNHPQYLRKWIHGMHTFSLPTDGSRAVTLNDTSLPPYMAAVESLNPGGLQGPWALCTADGAHEAPIGGGVVYPYLEHRQIGR